MSVNFSNSQPQKTRKGMAIASLVLGIISVPTLGLLVVGAITAIVLGVIALNRTRKAPAEYGGKGIAISGIITSVLSLLLIPVFGILAAIAVPGLTKNLMQARESAALQSMRTFHLNEMKYKEQNLKFATLRELAETGYFDRNFARGTPTSGYIYSSSDVSEETYCLHAVRSRSSVARYDYVVCEDGMIRKAESKTPTLVKRGEGDYVGFIVPDKK